MTMKWCSVSSLDSHQEQCTCRPQTVQDGSYCIVERSSYLDLHWGWEGEGKGGMGGRGRRRGVHSSMCISFNMPKLINT